MIFLSGPRIFIIILEKCEELKKLNYLFVNQFLLFLVDISLNYINFFLLLYPFLQMKAALNNIGKSLKLFQISFVLFQNKIIAHTM